MKGTTKHLSKTRKYGKATYRLDRSSRLKRNANKRADKLREDGVTARVMKMGNMWRVYKGPKR